VPGVHDPGARDASRAVAVPDGDPRGARRPPMRHTGSPPLHMIVLCGAIVVVHLALMIAMYLWVAAE
jgi:hypothetical protein